MARAIGREPREGVQKGFEEGEATGSWRDGQRGLVCGQAVCATGWHRESGATRSSSYLCPTLPRLQRTEFLSTTCVETSLLLFHKQAEAL
jgi:hypothetical protein